ncbi:DUF4964 domain-containing protein [Microbacter margulisiae]|uniref:DUF4964 domain-containing protein n=1 Tax=Microbacter margulisiae TaxID=1350067 RepID=A0A7W5DPE6_9PORP|nr:DUF4964 domain-containing protein [Microbacter margulisiae]MBB3186532.1 hypothetical protein [Microbacter margulisiae]
MKQKDFKAIQILLALFSCIIMPPSLSGQPVSFRPPAVPLVTFDPYLSIWSEADHLTDKNK